MSPDRPDDYADPTKMARQDPAHAPGEPREAAAPDAAAREAAAAEQDAKRIEKIPAHASSHRTAGTTTLDT